MALKLLVTGREGQVAQALLAKQTDHLQIEALGRPTLDLTYPSSIDLAIAAFRPDVIVNAAAYTAVDKAESEEEAALPSMRRAPATSRPRPPLPVCRSSTSPPTTSFPATRRRLMSRQILRGRRALMAVASWQEKWPPPPPTPVTLYCVRLGSMAPMATTS